MDEAFKDFIENDGAFILSLSNIENIHCQPILARYIVIAQKPVSGSESISIKITGNPSIQEIQGVSLQ
jgi:hypothetical protein